MSVLDVDVEADGPVDAVDLSGVGLGGIATAEGAAPRRLRTDRRVAATGRRGGLPGRRGLRWLTILAVAVAVFATGAGRRPLVNPGGWTLFARFWRAAAHPELSSAYLRQTGKATFTTLGYAVLGAGLSLVLGGIGGVALSQRVLSRRVREDRPSIVVRIARLALVVPRGIHEAVWALVLLTVLGRDPLVAVLAIGIPYGAITAKVYADILDESVARQHRTLRAAGAGRLQALFYGTLPTTGAELASYGFYRFECAVRAAVVLGMVGTGGLGFQLNQSFQGLAYRQMWTSLYALIVLGAAAEWWSGRVRRSHRARRPTIIAAIILAVASWWQLRPHVSRLWSHRTASRIARWYRESWPPKLPRGGLDELWRAGLATIHVSFLAIIGATLLAVPLALLAARRPGSASRSGGRGSRRRARSRFGGAAVKRVARFVALVIRSIPPTVWALLALFVLFPGVVPGAVALGIYTAGVLTRLFAEAIENADSRAHDALEAAGAGRIAAFAYGRLPTLAPRWTAFSLYRWEVAARDAAVVGIVGTAGLGRLLVEQTAGFAYPRMTTTVIALIVVTFVVDAISTLLRGRLR